MDIVYTIEMFRRDSDTLMDKFLEVVGEKQELESAVENLEQQKNEIEEELQDIKNRFELD